MKNFYRSCTCIFIAMALLLSQACQPVETLPPVASNAAILAFGDSITHGAGASPDESYPAVLERLTGRRVINAGVPGEVTAAGLARLHDVLEQEKPALMILCLGGNDMLLHLDQRQTADNLRAMVRMTLEHGVEVVLVAVPAVDVTLTPPPFYKQIAEEFMVPCETKALPRILGKRTLKSDHIHPNAAGYKQLAEELYTLLKRSGALK